MLDQPEQLGVADVKAEVPVQGADSRQVVVERLLDASPVIPEPPYPVGCAGEDQEAKEPLHREHAQDQRAAQFLAPADQRRRGGWSAAVLPVSHECAAAQAPPRRPVGGPCHQPVPQLRLVRRVTNVPLAGAAEQAPVHVLRIGPPPGRRAPAAALPTRKRSMAPDMAATCAVPELVREYLTGFLSPAPHAHRIPRSAPSWS